MKEGGQDNTLCMCVVRLHLLRSAGKHRSHPQSPAAVLKTQHGAAFDCSLPWVLMIIGARFILLGLALPDTPSVLFVCFGSKNLIATEYPSTVPLSQGVCHFVRCLGWVVAVFLWTKAGLKSNLSPLEGTSSLAPVLRAWLRILS